MAGGRAPGPPQVAGPSRPAFEDELKRLGGDYSKEDDWKPYVVEDGRLITGQNPNSAGPVANTFLAQLSV